MKSRHSSFLINASTLFALAWLTPSVVLADATVFKTDFLTVPDPNTLQADPGEITPTYTNWYIHSGKNASASNLSGGRGLQVTYAPASSAAGVEAIARFTNSPLSLSAVGDSITARATFYTDNIGYLSVGLYESGGINPLTNLQNAGLDGTVVSGGTGGTLGWKGYRARVQRDTLGANIAARPAQTGATVTRVAYDLVAANTNEFNSPGPLPVGSATASATTVIFPDFSAEEYKLSYTITRTAADELSFSYTIYDSANTVKYSTSGVTTNAGARPSAITSTFDALAIGTRNNVPAGQGSSISELAVSTLTITANNSQVARIVHEPINQTWVAGTPGSISVDASGVGPLTYQWYKNDVLIEAATAATYSVASPTGDDAGTYHVVVSNAYGTSVSADATVSLAPAGTPVLTTEPATQTVNAGETLTLVSLASGAPTPSYQWSKFNGSTYVAISGAIYPTYTIPATTTTDAGTYRVTVTNGSGSDFADAVVSINTAVPSITVDPLPVVVNVGSPIALTVTATGYPAPSYQWFKDSGSGPVLISGATGASFTVASATTGDIGSYFVVATNTINSVTSSATSAAASVTVNVVAPAITTPPSSITVALGQAATFTVSATGSAPLFYQWYKGSDPIAGATSSSYTINPTVGSSGGDYHVVVSNEGGPATAATSASATLNLIVTEETKAFETTFEHDTIHAASPVITPTSTNWYVMATKNATISHVGDDPLTTDVVEARPLNLGLNALTSAGNYQTAAVFTQTPLSLASVGSSVTVTVTFIPTNILNFGFGLFNSAGSVPHNFLNEGTTGKVIATATGNPAGTDGIFGGTQNWTGYHGFLNNGASAGSIVRRLAQNNPTPTDSRSQDLVTNGSNSSIYQFPVNASIGSLTNSVTGPLAWTTGSQYTLVYRIARSAADAYSIGYQLYTGPATTVSSSTQIFSSSGTTTAATALPSAVATSFDSFAFGGRSTNNAAGSPLPQISVSKMTVTHAVPVEAIFPSVTTDPVSQTIAVGQPFTLTAAATGSPTPTYQWYKGATLLEGQTSATYTVASATVDDAGDYTFVATNVLGSDTSAVATITISGGGASAFDIWADGFGLNPATTGAPGANPSGDGVPNLIKFVLGGNPTVAGSTALPAIAKVGNNLTFTYDLETAATSEYAVVAQTSTDLVTWTNAVNGAGGVSISTTPVDGNTNRVVVTVPQSGARLFIRLQVSELP